MSGNDTGVPAAEDEASAGSVFVGIILAICAAACIGISMVTQRYSLASLDEFPRFFCCRLSKGKGWFIGLILYGVANGLQTASLTLGPLFLLGGVFTLLLVFNLLFARIILNESVTAPKVCRAVCARILRQPTTVCACTCSAGGRGR